MKKNEIKAIIAETASKYGFIAEESTWASLMMIREQDTHYMNFTITESWAKDTDWSKREITMQIHFNASLASMGGNPTPDELIRASEIIRNGAEMVKELEAMNLSYTETC